MITEELKNLKREFLRIKKMGYIKSTRGGYSGIGKTFEDMLGKKEDRLENPDYHGIEIKTKRGYSTSFTTLFNATPENKDVIKRLRKRYGYPESEKCKDKILHTSVQANCSTLVANRFLFKLKVDYEKERVYLIITNKNFSLIENDIYWSFKLLKTKLNRKLKYLALVKAWPNTINGVEYYKYYDIDFYQLKAFDEFLKLIEDGKICVNFNIDIHKKGPRAGEIHDHGTSFRIQEMDLIKLFNRIEVN